MVEEGKGFQEDPRLEKFVGNLRSGMNRTEAAMNAGYGSNYNSAKATAWRLCRRREVAEMLAELPKVTKRGGGSRNAVRLAKGVAEGLTEVEAARRAGYGGKNDNTLHACGSRALAYSGNLKVIGKILESHGLDDDCGARVLKEGLSSMRQVVVYQGKDEPAMVVEYPDNVARKMYLDVLLRLRGHYRDTGAGSAGNIIFQISESLKGALPPTRAVDAEFKEVK